MSYFIVDTRDRIAQRVTEDASTPTDPRFVKVCAASIEEAFSVAGIERARVAKGTVP